MTEETEKKFLVDLSLIPYVEDYKSIIQFYLTLPKDSLDVCYRQTLSVHDGIEQDLIRELHIKKPINKDTCIVFHHNVSYEEFKYAMNYLQGYIIIKKRLLYVHKNFLWEIDKFEDMNSGLVIAEIELPSSNTEFSIPPFAIKDITKHKNVISNQSLALKPYHKYREEIDSIIKR